MSLLEREINALIPKDFGVKSQRQSMLLDYLPAMFAGDDFFNRFLLIFEDTLRPIQHQADDFHYYFDPLTAPPDLLPWLSTWVALVLDPSWPIEKRRQLIHDAVELYSWRGTRRGLSQYIELYLDTIPEISEYVDGMRLNEESRLGINTTIAGRERHSFTVTLHLNDATDEEIAAKEIVVRKIIEAEKPAHTAYRLRIVTNGHEQ